MTRQDIKTELRQVHTLYYKGRMIGEHGAFKTIDSVFVEDVKGDKNRFIQKRLKQLMEQYGKPKALLCYEQKGCLYFVVAENFVRRILWKLRFKFFLCTGRYKRATT